MSREPLTTILPLPHRLLNQFSSNVPANVLSFNVILWVDGQRRAHQWSGVCRAVRQLPVSSAAGAGSKPAAAPWRGGVCQGGGEGGCMACGSPLRLNANHPSVTAAIGSIARPGPLMTDGLPAGAPE